MLTWTFFDGNWREGSVPLMYSTTNAAWLGNTVFDGARRYDGVFPDLGLHCVRVIRSATLLGMMPDRTAQDVEALVREGAQFFDRGLDLYIRPMFWIEDGLGPIDPASTRFALVIQQMPMPDVKSGFSAHISDLRKPLPETAPTLAKASCLYPQATMAWGAARTAGFDNAVMLDAHGAVAEFTMQNLFLVSDGAVHTPAANGMLLAGITRARSIMLLRDLGYDVIERTIMPEELLTADEVISTGNHARVHPCRKIDDRELGVGPIGTSLINAYSDFAHDVSS